MENICECIISPREIKGFIDRKLSDPLSEMGLTPSEGSFVTEIGRNEGISMKGLSEQTGVDKALITRKVSALMEKGFVQNSSSGHEYSLILTEKGRSASSVIKTEL